MHHLTDFLYARPSFIEGLAGLIDFGGTLNVYNASVSEEQADAIALLCDWRMIGQDLTEASLTLEKEAEAAREYASA